jgi:hypothetical protein
VQRKKTGTPATVAEAVNVLDLTTFPLLKGADEPSSRTVAQLSYNAASDCTAANVTRTNLCVCR